MSTTNTMAVTLADCNADQHVCNDCGMLSTTRWHDCPNPDDIPPMRFHSARAAGLSAATAEAMAWTEGPMIVDGEGRPVLTTNGTE